jgi:hypothetical protein
MEDRKPFPSNEGTTESSDPENPVTERPKETGVPAYPDWTPFEFVG